MIEVKDMSQIHRYIKVPLYLRTSTGNYVLYKKKDETIDTKRRFTDDFPTSLFISNEDVDAAIKDVNRSIHNELIEAIKKGDLETSKSLLIESVENMFQNPRAEVLVEIAGDIVKSINLLELSSLQQFLSISVNDYTTAAHSVCLGALAVNFAKKSKWSWEKTQVFALSALLHDIGKTEIPSEILQKGSILTDDEFKIIQDHTITGGQILEDHNYKSDTIKRAVVSAAVYHHQKLDGSGYPRKEKMLLSYPIQAIGMLDAYEALTSDERPYRKPLLPSETLAILKKDTLNGKYSKEVFADVVNSLKK